MKCAICNTPLEVKVTKWRINGTSEVATPEAICFACMVESANEVFKDVTSVRPLEFELRAEDVDTPADPEVPSTNEMPNVPEAEPDAEGLPEGERRSDAADEAVHSLPCECGPCSQSETETDQETLGVEE